MENGPGHVFRVTLRMEVARGMAETFEKVWLGVGNTIAGETDNLGQWLLKSADDDDVYYVVSDWQGEPSFRAFERSAQHAENRRKLSPYRLASSMSTAHLVFELPKVKALPR